MKPESLLFLIAIILRTESLSLFGRTVKTPLGRIKGKVSYIGLKSVQTFLGIPFAKPPVGPLRFKKPEPVAPWSGKLKANQMPPACIQYTTQPYPWYDSMPGKSEDCLYLNIWAPGNTRKDSKKAVLFWIYGGGFTFGSNRQEVYDASALAAIGDVMVVTINYRMGVLGFITSGTDAAPGNIGMYDMVQALKWVNQNIESFGGDPNRVTLSGQSAGSIAISFLCVSPLTKGLFSKAIMESGSAIFVKDNQLPLNLNMTQRIAVAVGCADNDTTIQNDPSKVIDCLRGKNATQLAYVQYSFNPLAGRSFFPQYGDELLPNNAVEDIINGNFHNVPLLIGNNRDEGSFQITAGNPTVFGFHGEKDPQINKTYGESMIRSTFSKYPDPDKLVDYYLGNVRDNDYDGIRQQVYTASGDNSLLCETVYFAESYAQRKNDVFFYFFVHRPSNTPWAPWMGVVHFEEIQFVFGRPLRLKSQYTRDEVRLSRQMVKIWSNFAKKGSPGTSYKWPKYSKETHQYIYINTTTQGKVGTGPHLENCNQLRSYYGF